MTRVVMLEDDEADGKTLYGHLERYAAAHHERFQIAWFKTSIEFIQERPAADIYFLDIQLPGINGMEAAEDLRSWDSETPVIFVTDLAKYAVGGYRVGALDFMVKPVSYDDFALRMSRAMRIIERKRQRSIFVQTKNGLAVMSTSKVAFVEVRGHNLVYRLCDESDPFSCRGSLAEVEERLRGASFVRVSNSCLVNVEHVRRIVGTELHMSTGETLYISRSKRKDVLSYIASYYGGNE